MKHETSFFVCAAFYVSCYSETECACISKNKNRMVDEKDKQIFQTKRKAFLCTDIIGAEVLLQTLKIPPEQISGESTPSVEDYTNDYVGAKHACFH